MNTTEQTKEECLSTLAHELRNPLASIMSSVELMRAQGQHSEEIPHLLEVIDQKVITMTMVLDNFLSASTAGRDTPSDEHTDTSERVSHTGFKVLVVDDNATAADSLSKLLILRGYDVRVAYGGAEGFKEARTFLPQAAILDIGMPGIDGYQLVAMLRKEDLSCSFIALTGYGQDKDKQKASNVGFDFHLTKPSRIKDIDAILQQVASATEKEVV